MYHEHGNVDMFQHSPQGIEWPLADGAHLKAGGQDGLGLFEGGWNGDRVRLDLCHEKANGIQVFGQVLATHENA